MTELEDLEDDSSDESCSEAGLDDDPDGNAENQDIGVCSLPDQPATAVVKPTRLETIKQGACK